MEMTWAAAASSHLLLVAEQVQTGLGWHCACSVVEAFVVVSAASAAFAAESGQPIRQQ